MTPVRNARMLMRYNAWANRLTFDAVAALPEGEAEKPRQNVFCNMVHTLNHNHVIGRDRRRQTCRCSCGTYLSC
ncbi:MAG: DinB family protein [Betaproteobacteria bacterium]